MAGGGEAFDHRHDARQFLALVHAFGTRPGRFAADIEDIGPFGRELQPMGDGLLGCGVAAAIRETVGRHVDDTHDQGPGGRRSRHRQGERGREGHDAARHGPALAHDDLDHRVGNGRKAAE